MTLTKRMFLLLTMSLFSMINASSDDVQRPNIMFILLDDLGYGDLSYAGGQFPTPNMDKIMTSSLILSRHYVHLLCSPSRTQFLTGRYAMNFGFGDFIPWDDTEIGGIPIGQPTLANWLREFGDYTTYCVGKWHVGYANERLTPHIHKGFDHFYGFYQGAIDYVTKEYEDIVDGNIGIFDFWEDGEANYDDISSDKNTMQLYADKIEKYLKIEGDKLKQNKDTHPFYMFLPLQAMHAPYPDIPLHKERCTKAVDETEYAVPDSLDIDHYQSTINYCTLLSLTDDTVGRIIGALHANDLYSNTLIVFTTDNGGEIVDGASNYPLRGTKGEMFEGNERVITGLSGGVIERMNLVGQRREHIMSNLDWTPTLLQFAGYLDDIKASDQTWDGVSQYDMIVNDEKIRNHLVLNIGDNDLSSACIIMEEEGNLYKYIVSTPGCIADRWVYSPLKRVVDSWSIVDKNDDGKSVRGFKLEDNKKEPFSKEIDNAYLFDLTYDESEMYNLLNKKLPHYNAQKNDDLLEKCHRFLNEWLEQNELFSSPMKMLHDKLEQGLPEKLEDGKFVRPFLSDNEYKKIINNMFDDDIEKGIFHSDAQRNLYLHRWQCPKNPNKKSLRSMVATTNRHNHMTSFVLSVNDLIVQLTGIKSLSSQGLNFLIINGIAILFFLFAFMCCVCRKIAQCRDKNEYEHIR